MNKIIITGSAGLIGSHLANKFLELGWLVTGIDNLIGGYYTNMPMSNENFDYINADILDVVYMKDIFNKIKPELVIHCAALAHEGLSVFSPKTITENIYSGTISIASAAIESKTKYFINTSSMARYGDAEAPFKEDVLPQPIDPYGLAKLHAEEQLNLLSDIHGIKVFHVVPHNVCGPHQCYTDPFRNVVSIFANRILHERPVFIYGDGEQQRSFSHVTDCVNAFITLCENRTTIKNGSVFNIGPDDGSEISISKLASIVGKYFNVTPTINYIPGRPREVRDAWVSTSKARNELAYTTSFTTEDTIRDTVLWMKQQPKMDFNYHLRLEIINDKTPKTWTEQLFND